MDEAALRIIVEDADAGRQTLQPGPQSAPPQSLPVPRTFQDVQQRQVQPYIQPPSRLFEQPEQGGASKAFDAGLQIVDQLRGTIGGLAGTFIGAALDAITIFRKQQIEQYKQEEGDKKRKDDLLGIQPQAAAAVPPQHAAPAASQPQTIQRDSLIPYVQETTQAVYAVERAVREVSGKPSPTAPPPTTATRPTAVAEPPQPYGTPRGRPPWEMGTSPSIPEGPASLGTQTPIQPLQGPGGGTGAIAAGSGGMSAVAIAGIAAAALAAREAIHSAVASGIKSGIGGLGEVFAGIATPGNDPSQPIAAFSRATVDAGEKLRYVAPALGFLTIAAGEAGTALSKLMVGLDQSAARYERFSPDIAIAQSVAEMRTELGDFRRAQQAGPALARYIEQRAIMENQIEDIKIRLLTKIAPAATSALALLEKLLPIVEVGLSPLVFIAELVKLIADDIADVFPFLKKEDAFDDIEATRIIMREAGAGGVRVPDVEGVEREVRP